MNVQFQRYPFLIVLVWAFFLNDQVTANTYEVPKLKAFLPMSYNVPPTEAMPLDGVYMIAGMDKRIRIEKGRSYAVDSWMVMMVFGGSSQHGTHQRHHAYRTGQIHRF